MPTLTEDLLSSQTGSPELRIHTPSITWLATSSYRNKGIMEQLLGFNHTSEDNYEISAYDIDSIQTHQVASLVRLKSTQKSTCMYGSN
jgi:hypothetical protein